MTPRLSVLTLGVDDLERAVAFYRDGLGWPTEGIVGTGFEHGAVAFFDLEGGMKLALFPRTSLARDMGVADSGQAPSPDASRGPVPCTRFSLGHNVRSREEVDGVMDAARAAGATILKAAQDTFWGGYAGYFLDPDGHVWEVVFNPELIPGA